VSSKDAIRRRGLKMLPAIYKRDRGKCRYCGKKVVMVRSIPEHRRELAATVDHLKRVDEGGDSDVDNLVLSCAPCNRQMDRHYQELKKL
jgi:5-methylcytosine-specific restriction endonuclease McrA